MMMRFLASALLVSSTGARELSNKTLSIVMDGQIPSYEVPVGLGTHFEVWTEKPCEAPSLGDPSVFKRDFDANVQSKNRFVLAVIKNIPERKAHFTLKCEGGLGVILQVRVTPNPEDAIGLIHVRTSDALNAFTAQAVQNALEQERQHTQHLAEEQRRAVLSERETINLKKLHARFVHHQDNERGRYGNVVVHVTEQISIGDRVYIIFRIQNESSHVFPIDAVEIHTKHNVMPTSQSFYMPTGRIEPKNTELGVIGFDGPVTSGPVKLIVKNNTGVRIEVGDVDTQ